MNYTTGTALIIALIVVALGLIFSELMPIINKLKEVF